MKFVQGHAGRRWRRRWSSVAATTSSIEQRILDAAESGNLVEFRKLADELGSLERAQELVRAHGIVERPAPMPAVDLR